MKSKNAIRREKLFRIYSNNLQMVKSHNEIKIEPDFLEGYLCPICFEIYDKSHLDTSCENPLTLEDIPPKALGGKPIALTCKKCNSICGHELDVHLVNRLIENEAWQFLPNSKFKTTFEKNGNKMGGLLEVDKNGIVKLDLRREWSNPKEEKGFMQDVFATTNLKNSAFYPERIKSHPEFKTEKFNVRIPSKSNERKAEIALLKSAYLYAFAKYGYSFLINGELNKVREQIMNPDKEILPRVFWIKYDFPEKALGLNFISEPKELRCYLIIFKVKTKSKDYKFAIALPGPSEPGLKIYENIESILCQKKDGFEKCQVEHVSELDYVFNKELIWASHIYWQKYCQDK